MTRADEDDRGGAARGFAFRAGALVQGTCLGVLLFLALCGLFAAWGDAQLFRYQGF